MQIDLEPVTAVYAGLAFCCLLCNVCTTVKSLPAFIPVTPPAFPALPILLTELQAAEMQSMTWRW